MFNYVFEKKNGQHEFFFFALLSLKRVMINWRANTMPYLNNNFCRLSKKKTWFFKWKISNFAIVLVLSNYKISLYSSTLYQYSFPLYSLLSVFDYHPFGIFKLFLQYVHYWLRIWDITYFYIDNMVLEFIFLKLDKPRAVTIIFSVIFLIFMKL